MRLKNPGTFYILVGAALWSFGGLLGKLIPFNGLTIAALRGLISAIVIGLYRKSFKVHLSPSVVLAGISLTLTTLLYMLSNKMTTAANAIVLQYTSPIYIIFFSWMIYKQKPKQEDLFALGGVSLGILLFFASGLSAGHLLGDFLGLASGLSFAGVFFANKLPNANPIDAVYLGNVLSILLIPFIFFDPHLNLEFIPWTLLLVMGIFQLGFGYIFFSKGIQRVSATSASILATLEPILNPIWVFLVMGELPSLLALAGAFLVLLTVTLYNRFITQKNT